MNDLYTKTFNTVLTNVSEQLSIFNEAHLKLKRRIYLGLFAMFIVVALCSILISQLYGHEDSLSLVLISAPFLSIIITIVFLRQYSKKGTNSFLFNLPFIAYFLFVFLSFACIPFIKELVGMHIVNLHLSAVIALPIGFIPFLVFYNRKLAILKNKYQEELLSPLLHSLDSKVDFTSGHLDVQEDIIVSDLFNSYSYDSSIYYCDSMFRTIIGNTPFSVFNVLVKSADNGVDKFKGVFLVGDLRVKFNGALRIQPDVTAGTKIGKLISKYTERTHSLIKTDHVKFEKYFKAYGFHMESVEEVLSDLFLDRIMEHKARVSPDVKKATILQSMFNLKLSLRDSHVYMMFDFTKGKSLMRKESVYEYPGFFLNTNTTKLLEDSYKKVSLIYPILHDLDKSHNEWYALQETGLQL